MSTINPVLKSLIRAYEESDTALHEFARPHVVKWLELLSQRGQFWGDYTDSPDIFRYTELDNNYAYFDSEYFSLSIPLPFFDDPEPYFEESRKAEKEREARKSLEAAEVRRKRIAELERLLAEDAPPTEIDIELTRR